MQRRLLTLRRGVEIVSVIEHLRSTPSTLQTATPTMDRTVACDLLRGTS